MWRNMQVRVQLINTRDKLLSFLDDEIIDAVSYHLSEGGMRILHKEEYERVEANDDGVILHLKSGKKIRSDILLWANGRTGNTEDLGLDDVGIKPDHRGQIDVNEHYQTYAAAHLCRRRRRRLSLAGQRFVRSGTFRGQPFLRRPESSSGSRHSDGHLYEPRDLVDRQDRTATDRREGAL